MLWCSILVRLIAGLPSPPLNTKKRTRQRCLDQDQTLRATTPALDEITSNRALASHHHFVKHLAIIVHIMKIDLRMVYPTYKHT